MNEKQSTEKAENNIDIEQRVYEISFLINPSLDNDQLQELIKNLEKDISKISDEIITISDVDLIDLAYTIKVNIGGKYDKYDKAYFGWIKFVTYPDRLSELKEELSFNKDIIRYMIIKTVREDTRAQLEQEAIQKLDEVKTEAASNIQNQGGDNGEDLSDEEIDKVVEELLAKIDDDVEDEDIQQDKKDSEEIKQNTNKA